MFKKYLKLFDELEYGVRRYDNLTESDWSWFLRLYKAIFRAIDKKVFQWYFDRENTFNILETKEHQEFGIYGLLNIRLNVNKETVGAYLCHNVGIKKEYSGKGFFQLIGEKALDGVLNKDDIALGFPNKASKKGHLRLGWETIGEMNFISYVSNDGVKIPLDKEYHFVNIKEFPQEIDEFIERTSLKFSLSLQKDREFLNWRISKPFSDHQVYLIKRSNRIVGYLVLKEYMENNEKRLHLVDLLFENNIVLINLIGFAINEYIEKEYDLLNTWVVRESIYQDVFLNKNFQIQEDMPVYPIILFQKDKKYDFSKIEKNNIFFTLLDNDVF